MIYDHMYFRLRGSSCRPQKIIVLIRGWSPLPFWSTLIRLPVTIWYRIFFLFYNTEPEVILTRNHRQRVVSMLCIVKKLACGFLVAVKACVHKSPWSFWLSPLPTTSDAKTTQNSQSAPLWTSLHANRGLITQIWIAESETENSDFRSRSNAFILPSWLSFLPTNREVSNTGPKARGEGVLKGELMVPCNMTYL